MGVGPVSRISGASGFGVTPMGPLEPTNVSITFDWNIRVSNDDYVVYTVCVDAGEAVMHSSRVSFTMFTRRVCLNVLMVLLSVDFTI